MKKFARRINRILRKEDGQSMVEMAICLPVLLLIVMGICDFGWLFYNKMGVENASREGARLAIVNADSACVATDVTAAAKAACMGSTDTTVTLVISGDDASVTVTKDVRVLTPLAGIFVGGQTVTLSSTTKMRIG